MFFLALGTSCEDHIWDKDIRVKIGRERQRQRRGKRSEWAYVTEILVVVFISKADAFCKITYEISERGS